MLRSARTPATLRRGISLLEVLISMFVLLVGLAGIASLLPAGRSEIMQGVKLDYAMMVGRNAFRELNARGFLKPQITPEPSPLPTPVTAPLPATPIVTNGWLENASTAVWRQDADPAFPFVLTTAAGGKTNSPAIVIDPLGINAGYGNQFPAGAPIPLARVTPLGNLTGTNAKLLADTIFRCEDDSVIKTNTVTKNGPPLRQEVPFGATGTAVMKLASAANYSWFATVVTDPFQSATSAKVNVSVAVVYKRDLSAAPSGESFCRVISLPGLGISGGEVILWKPAKALRPGQWVMMAGFDDTSGTRRDFFYWYKVLAASPITQVNQLPSLSASKPSNVSSNDNVQPVTLAGADWGRNLFPATANTATTVTSPTGWPTMFIVDNVIAVYEKSMDLEF